MSYQKRGLGQNWPWTASSDIPIAAATESVGDNVSRMWTNFWYFATGKYPVPQLPTPAVTTPAQGPSGNISPALSIEEQVQRFNAWSVSDLMNATYAAGQQKQRDVAYQQAVDTSLSVGSGDGISFDVPKINWWLVGGAAVVGVLLIKLVGGK